MYYVDIHKVKKDFTTDWAESRDQHKAAIMPMRIPALPIVTFQTVFSTFICRPSSFHWPLSCFSFLLPQACQPTISQTRIILIPSSYSIIHPFLLYLLKSLFTNKLYSQLL